MSFFPSLSFLARLGVALGLTLGARFAPAAEPLVVTYPEKPPYYYTEAGVARGQLLELATRIFATAGIPAVFAARPAPRALGEVAESGANVCSLGWFKSVEREKFARFSRPIYRDRPIRLLVRADRRKDFENLASLEQVLVAPQFRIGVVAGFSYGMAPDALLQRAGGRVTARVSRVEQLFGMVGHGRIDLAPVNEMEFSHFTRSPQPSALALLAFADAPPGNLRYLMCGRGVPATTMERIDAAILELGIDVK